MEILLPVLHRAAASVQGLAATHLASLLSVLLEGGDLALTDETYGALVASANAPPSAEAPVDVVEETPRTQPAKAPREVFEEEVLAGFAGLAICLGHAALAQRALDTLAPHGGGALAVLVPVVHWTGRLDQTKVLAAVDHATAHLSSASSLARAMASGEMRHSEPLGGAPAVAVPSLSSVFTCESASVIVASKA